MTKKVSKGIVIKLGQSESALSNELTSGYAVNTVNDKFENKRVIAAKVARADVLHINLHDFYGSEQKLNAYLEETMKQRKLMVFENPQDMQEMIIDAIPGMPSGDVVLFQPRDHADGDSITVFGGYSITTSKDVDKAEGSEDGKSLNQQQIADMVSQQSQFIEDNDEFDITRITSEARIAQMQGDELDLALNAVTSKISNLLKQATAIQTKVTTSPVSGGRCRFPHSNKLLK